MFLLVLFVVILAQAFPEGPNAAQATKREVQVAPPEIRFLQGVMRPPGARSPTATLAASATLSRPGGDPALLHFAIEAKGTLLAVGDWSATAPGTLVPDTEAISGWRACWWGQRNASGQLVDAERAAKLRAAKTFGEVRGLKESSLP